MEERKPLEKEYFEKLVNCAVSDYDMKCINKIWMHYIFMFSDVNDIVVFYQLLGMEYVGRMCCEVSGEEAVIDLLTERAQMENERYIKLRVKCECCKGRLAES